MRVRLVFASIPLLLSGCGSPSAPVPPGEIRFAYERDGHVSTFAVRAAGGDPSPMFPEDGRSFYPAEGPLPLAVAAMGEGGDHRESLVLAGPGGALRSLGPTASRARNPSVAPGGAWLVLEASHQSFADLYRVDVAGGAVTRLTDDPEGNFEPHVSPDGRRVAFVSSRDGDTEIYVMAADGTGQTRLTFFHRDDWSPRWSPRGDALVFLSDREGADRVFVMRPDGTEQRRLTKATPSGAPEADPAWSPDGSKVAYVVRAGDGASVWVADVASGKAERLTPEGESESQPAWSPDGRWIVVSAARGAEADLVVVSVDGEERRVLTRLPGAEWLPRWN